MGKRGKRPKADPGCRCGDVSWPVDWRRQPADLQPVSRRPLAMQAADQLRRRITLGDLQPGQRIESARKLSGELRISLPVLREAIAALAYLGLIEVRHGVGMFVARRPRASRAVRAAAHRADLAELHALRETLAAEAAARAASHRPNRGADARPAPDAGGALAIGPQRQSRPIHPR